MVTQPNFADDEFEPSLASVLNELQALDDEPRQKVILELVRLCYPQPWNQPPEGAVADVEELTPAAVQAHWKDFVTPRGAILGVAGRVVPDEVFAIAEAAFGAWSPVTSDRPGLGDRGGHHLHLMADSSQTHIGLAFPSIPYRHDDYFAAWVANSVLSGGMSSRLFTEVREKRGLCYSVYSTLSSQKDFGNILSYCGTTPDRAQESLDVLMEEFHKLAEGVSVEELQRSQALAKSSLIMQQESSSSRAGSIARDWYHRGAVLPMDEIQRRIAALTPRAIHDYLARHPFRDPTLVTVGPQALQLPTASPPAKIDA